MHVRRGGNHGRQDVLANTNQLVEEEHQLEQSRGTGGLSEAEHRRLRQIEVALDQCWDLLRQRRARRDVGHDPTEAAVRDANRVEGYRQ
ncbi:MAG: DUF2630 family protein [Actinomycetota bacterium]